MDSRLLWSGLVWSQEKEIDKLTLAGQATGNQSPKMMTSEMSTSLQRSVSTTAAHETVALGGWSVFQADRAQDKEMC